jgi:pyrroline-5-carboxylate reductase
MSVRNDLLALVVGAATVIVGLTTERYRRSLCNPSLIIRRMPSAAFRASASVSYWSNRSDRETLSRATSAPS